MNQTIESALGFLSKFVDVDVLQQGVIEVALGIVLHLDTVHSTQAFNVFRHERGLPAATHFVKQVDFRVPVNPEQAGQEFLYIAMLPTPGINAEAVMQHYGQPQKVVAATPQESLGSGIAVTYVYLLGKRDVSFSFGPSPEQALVAIALERHQ